ncbi:MAG: chromate transporter [Eubacterium sp.]|nr:chromate transporter [Eubacterium sp.]
MKEKLKKVFQLFITFIKIGAFTFGGGYAMVPLIQRETVEKKKWINDDDILEIVAIAESTPGPIAVNSATFVGYKTAGVLGAAAATIGVVLPSFTIIYFISFVIDKFENNTAVKYAFSGVRAGVLALIIKALWTMSKKSAKNIISFIITAFAFVFAALNINVIYIILACAVTGIVSSLIMSGREKKKNDDIS